SQKWLSRAGDPPKGQPRVQLSNAQHALSPHFSRDCASSRVVRSEGTFPERRERRNAERRAERTPRGCARSACGKWSLAGYEPFASKENRAARFEDGTR